VDVVVDVDVDVDLDLDLDHVEIQCRSFVLSHFFLKRASSASFGFSSFAGPSPKSAPS
jgi:hypothetical protein